MKKMKIVLRIHFIFIRIRILDQPWKKWIRIQIQTWVRIQVMNTSWRNWKGKIKGGISWKLITLALDRDPWKLYLMFLSREIDIKLCLYTKIHIYTYTVLYRNSRFKQIIFSKYATNLKTKISLGDCTQSE